MIPKILFTYWEGSQLSELHYYTIYSLCKYNPDLNIIIYTSLHETTIFRQWNTGEHPIDINKTILLDYLVNNINPNRVKLHKIDFNNEYNINNNVSCVYKADFVRIVKLYEHGGIWFDMDILFIKPIPDFFFIESIDTYIFSYTQTIATGFIASIPQSNLLTKLYNNAKNIINNNINSYQKLGPDLWRECYFNNKYTNIKILDNKYIYPYIWDIAYKIFNTKDDSHIVNITFGIHWYNGSVDAKKFINNFNKNNIQPNRSVCEKYIGLIENIKI